MRGQWTSLRPLVPWLNNGRLVTLASGCYQLTVDDDRQGSVWLFIYLGCND